MTRCQDKGTNHTPYFAPSPSTPPALVSPSEQDAAEETEPLPPPSLLHPHGHYANNYSVGTVYTPFVLLHTFPPSKSKVFKSLTVPHASASFLPWMWETLKHGGRIQFVRLIRVYKVLRYPPPSISLKSRHHDSSSLLPPFYPFDYLPHRRSRV